ncbi:MAG: c-type cytochrome biogenesis protein CcsB [Candidatus Subteraquimicrobiales bacterium]|nr:c-type cytochrome biogenesis protein CcsB [Candidatus Subteraquimicrobiales bacterium]
MNFTEVILMWAGITFYALSAVFFVIGLTMKKERLLSFACWAVAAGLIPHAVAIGIRWVEAGHGPYMGFYEVASGLVWVGVATMLLVVWRFAQLRPVGAVVMPISFLLMAAALMTSKEIQQLPPTLRSYWLWIHIAFAKLTYGSLLIATGLAVLYLLKRRFGEKKGSVLYRLPDLKQLDDLSYRFILLGFLFLGMMVVAGSIWANEAWGRYWGWDPIETWSFVSWVVYGIYLHQRLSRGWRGTKAAWLAIAAMVVVVFALLGVPFVYQSIHSAYM